jgi:hypothetical protein
MRRSISVVLLLIALVGGGSFGLLAASAQYSSGQAAGEISASATLLKTTGSPGRFLLPEPPGYGPISCYWDADPFGGGIPLGFITTNGAPVVYPQTNAPQKVELVVKTYRRLPNGELQLTESRPVPITQTANWYVPADFTNSFGIYGMAIIGDSGSKYLMGNEIRWYN